MDHDMKGDTRLTTKDLGVWTSDACALVLIDYQNEMFEVIRSETDAVVGAGIALDQGASIPNTVLGFAILVALGVTVSGWALLRRR
jgi:hypothetical protein